MSPARRDGDGWWPESRPRKPGTGPRRAAGRQPFGATWWGAAWIDALEHRARLDPNRLPRGRTYARTGQVEALELGPGRVLAAVQGSADLPYAVEVRVTTLTDDEWERVLDELASRAGHAAALLDGELPPGVAEDVRATGLDLLPGAGEIRTTCSCPDRAEPCKHAAAVCYLVADELDDDPFALLALRGRGRDEVLAGLRARRTDPGLAPAAGFDDTLTWVGDDGVPAAEAWTHQVAPLPRLPTPPRSAGTPPVPGSDPPPGSGLRADRLHLLAADAAERALDLAGGATGSGLELDRDEDIARWAARLLERPAADGSSPAGPTAAELARAGDLTDRELHRRALAWRDGGPGAYAALVGTWDPTPEQLAPGRELLGPSARARRNRLTAGDEQLRLGADGHWYPYRRTRSGWDPDGPRLEDTELGPPPGDG